MIAFQFGLQSFPMTANCTCLSSSIAAITAIIGLINWTCVGFHQQSALVHDWKGGQCTCRVFRPLLQKFWARGKNDRRSYKLHHPPLGSVCITGGWKKDSGPYLQWIAVHFDTLDPPALGRSASEGEELDLHYVWMNTKRKKSCIWQTCSHGQETDHWDERFS